MLLISTYIDGDSKSFKAPPGKTFLIDQILTVNNLGVVNYLLFRESYQKKPITGNINIQNSEIFYIVNLANADTQKIERLNMKTKYLTIFRQLSAITPDVLVFVYGDIINASRRELLIEWFRKVR